MDSLDTGNLNLATVSLSLDTGNLNLAMDSPSRATGSLREPRLLHQREGYRVKQTTILSAPSDGVSTELAVRAPPPLIASQEPPACRLRRSECAAFPPGCQARLLPHSDLLTEPSVTSLTKNTTR